MFTSCNNSFALNKTGPDFIRSKLNLRVNHYFGFDTFAMVVWCSEMVSMSNLCIGPTDLECSIHLAKGKRDNKCDLERTHTHVLLLTSLLEGEMTARPLLSSFSNPSLSPYTNRLPLFLPLLLCRVTHACGIHNWNTLSHSQICNMKVARVWKRFKAQFLYFFVNARPGQPPASTCSAASKNMSPCFISICGIKVKTHPDVE